MRIAIFAVCFAGVIGTQPISAATIDFELTGTVLNVYSVPESIETDIVPPQYGDVLSVSFQFDTDAPLLEVNEDVWPEEGLFDEYSYYNTSAVTGSLNGAPIQTSTTFDYNNVELLVDVNFDWSRPFLDDDTVRLIVYTGGLSLDIDSAEFPGTPNFVDLPLEEILEGFAVGHDLTTVFDRRILDPATGSLWFTLENITLTSSFSDDSVPPGPDTPDPLPSPVPLPASLGFLLAGLAVLRLVRPRSVAQ